MFFDKLIETYDSSFFLYDLDGLDQHLKAIKSTLDPDIKVWYACKANPLSEILRVLKHNGFGVDVASLGELQQAQNAGVTNLIATGPAKSQKYLRTLMEKKVSTIVIESLQQLRDCNKVAGELGLTQNVLLRVQLDWSQDLKSVLGGSSITPFGLGVRDWEKISLQEYANLSINGLHCFQWGNILDLATLKELWDTTIAQCVDLARTLKLDLKVLDLGGGLGVPYQGGTDLPFPEVHSLLKTFKDKYRLKEVWLELGRYTIANFGTYCTKVVDVKTVRGKNIVVTEGGINHIARPALVSEAFPCRSLRPSTVGTTNYAVHGPLCTALDKLGDLELPKDLREGDWLAFSKVGAYGFTESMPFFLCHDLPIEAFLRNGDLHVPREPKTSASWMV